MKIFLVFDSKLNRKRFESGSGKASALANIRMSEVFHSIQNIKSINFLLSKMRGVKEMTTIMFLKYIHFSMHLLKCVNVL